MLNLEGVMGNVQVQPIESLQVHFTECKVKNPCFFFFNVFEKQTFDSAVASLL